MQDQKKRKSKHVMDWRRRTKAKLVKMFGGKCVICGYNKCNAALEFHHLDPTTKSTIWGRINGHIRSWDIISQEMAKCVMLCSNCHKEFHNGVTTIPEDAPRFNPELT